MSKTRQYDSAHPSLFVCLLISVFFIFLKTAAKTFVECAVEEVTAAGAVVVVIAV